MVSTFFITAKVRRFLVTGCRMQVAVADADHRQVYSGVPGGGKKKVKR